MKKIHKNRDELENEALTVRQNESLVRSGSPNFLLKLQFKSFHSA